MTDPVRTLCMSLALALAATPAVADDAAHGGQAAEQAGSEQAGSEQAGSEQAGSEQAGSEHAGSEQAGSEQAGSEQAASEQAASAHPTNYRHRHDRGRIIRYGAPPPHGVQRVRASRPYRPFMYIGLGALGNFVLGSGDDASRVYNGGGGLDVMFGLRPIDAFAIELAYMASFHSTTTSTVTMQEVSNGVIQGLTLDGRIFILPQAQRIQPFAQIGIGLYMLSEQFKEQLSGVGLDLGGGVDIMFSQHVGIGLRLLYRGFYVDNSDAEWGKIATESAFLNTLTAEANIQFHF